MSKIKKINKKLKLNYNDIEKLNDYDFILVSTRFLEFTQAYYSVIDKNPDMLKIINPILNSYSKEVITPLYIRLSVLEIKNIYRNFPKDRFWKSTFKKNIVVNISLKDAYDLLTKDIITKEEDLYLPQNRWILHSIYASHAAPESRRQQAPHAAPMAAAGTKRQTPDDPGSGRMATAGGRKTKSSRTGRKTHTPKTGGALCRDAAFGACRGL